MKISMKRRPSDIAWGLLLLSHPLPVLIHVVGVTLFTLLAAWPTFIWQTIVLVIAAHTAMQLAIAVLNDYCDRHLDALGKKRKPIPLGLVQPREALVLGIALIALMFVLLLPLPPLALLLSVLYLALGLGYNLGLKSTPLSGIVFALAMPLIPIYAFVGVGHIIPLLYWLVPVAALLGVSLNLANSLPDIEEDAAQGVRTLAVVLGVRASFFASTLLILCAEFLIVLLSAIHIVPLPLFIRLFILFAINILILLMLFLYNRSRFTDATKLRTLYFYLVTITCLLLAVSWIIGAILSCRCA